MKLSNVVIRVCYMTALLYLCYTTYHHIDILRVQFHKTLIENFHNPTGVDMITLTKKTNLGAEFSNISYGALIGNTWGTSDRDDSKEDAAPRSRVNFNFTNSEVDIGTDETPGVPTGEVSIDGAGIGTLSPDDVSALPSETETHIRESEEIDWGNWTYDSTNNRWHCSSDCFVTNTKPPRTTSDP